METHELCQKVHNAGRRSKREAARDKKRVFHTRGDMEKLQRSVARVMGQIREKSGSEHDGLQLVCREELGQAQKRGAAGAV